MQIGLLTYRIADLAQVIPRVSRAKPEYMAMTSATQEALWLRQLQEELG